ncbi:hypothetical protein B0A53_06419 [Rhodotorula sp. CCFEE 5036]|nr:hypothetical protein B0A53_06419 [Rhodotorula sp. CCFEE 5036]
MSHPSSQPRSAALAEATQRSPTLSRPPDDEVQTLLTGFTARRPTQAVTAALRSISAICSNLNISRDRIVFNWFKTVTGLLKRGAGGQWAYDSWDKSQKVTFGRSLKVIEKNVLKAQRTGFQAVLDVLENQHMHMPKPDSRVWERQQLIFPTADNVAAAG